MIICHCMRVNDRQIRQAVHEGAETVGMIGRQNHAGTCCGGCVSGIVEILEDEREYQRLPVAAE